MTWITDQNYLRDQQYKNASNLEARINLHRRFGTSTESWFHWVLDQIALAPGTRLLELGCGPGSLWRENQGRLPPDFRPILGDLSWGMANAARQGLKDQEGFTFLALDAQAIPFPSQHFDVVVANHMLYHIPNLTLAIEEVHRVLKPGGRLVAATNGVDHMENLYALIHEFQSAYTPPTAEVRGFSLENGAEILGVEFPRVEVRRFEDDLIVTEVEPLLAYIGSMWGIMDSRGPAEAAALEAFLQDKLAGQGSIYIRKSQGLVVGMLD